MSVMTEMYRLLYGPPVATTFPWDGRPAEVGAAVLLIPDRAAAPCSPALCDQPGAATAVSRARPRVSRR